MFEIFFCLVPSLQIVFRIAGGEIETRSSLSTGLQLSCLAGFFRKNVEEKVMEIATANNYEALRSHERKMVFR